MLLVSALRRTDLADKCDPRFLLKQEPWLALVIKLASPPRKDKMNKSTKRLFLFFAENQQLIKKSFGYPAKYELSFIFLCGKSRSPDDNRDFLKKSVLSPHNQLSIYSEDFFALFQKTALSKIDLLTFEEVIMQLSNAVVLLLESLGSACELGSFSLVDTELEKLYVVADKKYENDTSYLNQGPLAKLKSKFPSHVAYEDFDPETGIINFSAASAQPYSEIKRSAFKQNPASVRNGVLEVKDASYLLWLLIDYVRLFGVIEKNEILPLLYTLYPGSKSFALVTSADNSLEEKDSVELVDALPELLVNLGVFSEKEKGSDVYFCLDYSLFKKRNIALYPFPRMIFKEESPAKTIDRLVDLMISAKKKEGYQLWTA